MNLVITTPLRRCTCHKTTFRKYGPAITHLRRKSSYTLDDDVETTPGQSKQDFLEHRRPKYGQRGKKGTDSVSLTSFPGTAYLTALKLRNNHATGSPTAKIESLSSSRSFKKGLPTLSNKKNTKFDVVPSLKRAENTKISKSAPGSEASTVDGVYFDDTSEVSGLHADNADQRSIENLSVNDPNVPSESPETSRTSPSQSFSTGDSITNSTSKGVIGENSLKNDSSVPSGVDADVSSENIKNGENVMPAKVEKGKRTPLEFEESYIKFRSEEMALLTDDKDSCDMLEAVLNCPLKLNDWDRVTKKDCDLLQQISDAFDPKKLPSVSKIMQKTAPPMNVIMLNKWKKKKIEELGEEGFQEYMKGITNEGKGFHKNIESYLGQENVEIEDTGQWKSVQPFLEKVTDVQRIEYNVSHSLLSYYGRLDCVAKYGDTLCIFDWKLSQKRKETLKKCYDDSYQVAAYTGAFNMSTSFDNQVSSAVVVKAYRDGTPADIHFMNEFVLTFYWDGWLRRLARHHVKEYNIIKEQ